METKLKHNHLFIYIYLPVHIYIYISIYTNGCTENAMTKQLTAEADAKENTRTTLFFLVCLFSVKRGGSVCASPVFVHLCENADKSHFVAFVSSGPSTKTHCMTFGST